MSSSSQIRFRDSLYLSDNPDETTFKYDENLPNLPIPSLQESISKLLDSIKPIAVDQPEAYKETERKAREFLASQDVSDLQALLKERADSSMSSARNFLLHVRQLNQPNKTATRQSKGFTCRPRRTNNTGRVHQLGNTFQHRLSNNRSSGSLYCRSAKR